MPETQMQALPNVRFLRCLVQRKRLTTSRVIQSTSGISHNSSASLPKCLLFFEEGSSFYRSIKVLLEMFRSPKKALSKGTKQRLNYYQWQKWNKISGNVQNSSESLVKYVCRGEERSASMAHRVLHNGNQWYRKSGCCTLKGRRWCWKGEKCRSEDGNVRGNKSTGGNIAWNAILLGAQGKVYRAVRDHRGRLYILQATRNLWSERVYEIGAEYQELTIVEKVLRHPDKLVKLSRVSQGSNHQFISN